MQVISNPGEGSERPSDRRGRLTDARRTEAGDHGKAGLGWEGDAYAPRELDAVRSWLGGKAMWIHGGSFEIQNNIVTKQVLGPPETTQQG